MKKALVLIACLAALSGCANRETLQEIGRAPAMSPIGSGLAYGQTPEMAMYPKQPRQVAAGYSLWSDSQAALFKDSRAINVGDIMTVNISINDQASFNNATNRSRTNKSAMDITASAIRSSGLSGNLSDGSSTSTKGNGTTARSEKLTLLIASVVTGILENGNLVISGSQEVRVNQELRILNIAGIVRPQDVSADNTISYDKIAEARISYGGRGRLSEVQNPPVGQQVIDLFSPF
jgi:flagellar L-ring protein FlgH